jgi:amino acid transporter
MSERYSNSMAVMIIAAFAYSGSEMVGMTAAEQRNPNRDMPKAIKRVFWRIGLVSSFSRS